MSGAPEPDRTSGETAPSEADNTDEPTSRIVGRLETPRALIVTEDDDFAEEIADLFPNSERVRIVQERRQEEFDIVVATEEFNRQIRTLNRIYTGHFPEDHLFLVAFGLADLGHVAVKGEKRLVRLTYTEGSIAREYEVPQVHPLVAELVETDLLAAARSRTGAHPTLGTDQLHIPVEETDTIPLLKTTEGKVLAAIFTRHGSGSGLGLALPGDVTDRVGWLKAALKLFRKITPERFQQIPGWEDRDQWSTAEERRIRGELAQLNDERERRLSELDRREESLKAQLAEASGEADVGLRGLLTLRGDELVPVVAEALERLGFMAKLVDQEADPNNKLEDLRVSDPSLNDDADGEAWEALAEVRGYKGGAKLSDLNRVERFVRRYRDETGRWPPAVWYIVNQRAGIDPDVREPVLHAQPEELEEWATSNTGLAIDTSDLFRLVVDVDAGRIEHSEARRRLRDGLGRFEHPMLQG